jgi:hypothetical protein
MRRVGGGRVLVCRFCDFSQALILTGAAEIHAGTHDGGDDDTSFFIFGRRHLTHYDACDM